MWTKKIWVNMLFHSSSNHSSTAATEKANSATTTHSTGSHAMTGGNHMTRSNNNNNNTRSLMRPQRIPTSANNNNNNTMSSTINPTSSTSAANSNGSMKYNNYAEQAELHEKHIEQLAREKRDLITKSLEENKEKMELSQRILALDKENATLKAELRKRTLEKERLERNLMKTGKISVGMEL
jgi:uncharacterized protein (DUF342 family)